MKNMKVLITGGTGSIGKVLANRLTDADITIFSRNEKDQAAMKLEYPEYNYIIGDVRDRSEVSMACMGMNHVFHLAALKHVNICEEQPQEAIKTNVIGTLNVIEMCHEWGVLLINMSSDKAINPANVYGMTKALAEQMVLESSHINIRSGNVLWSAGSVLHIWKKQLAADNKISLTSDKMTRFFIRADELADFMIDKIGDKTGTYTVPMKSFRLFDIAEEFVRRYGNRNSSIVLTGLRPGERLHEFRDESTSSEHNICYDLSYIFN